MSKARRIEREAERQRLGVLLKQLRADSETLSARITDSLFDACETAVLELINKTASGFTGRERCDETAGAEFVRLFDSYREALALYERDREHLSFTVKTIMEGIFSVLSSRLRMHAERNEGAVEISTPRESEIISESIISKIKNGFESQKNNFMQTGFPEIAGVTQRISLSNNDSSGGECDSPAARIAESMKSRCFDDFYSIYADAAREILSDLDGLDTRAAASECVNQMENEYEIINDIMRVQAAALEFVVSRTTEENSDEESVRRILNRLDAGYRRLGEFLAEIKIILPEEKRAAENEFIFDYAPFEKKLFEASQARAEGTREELSGLVSTLSETRVSILELIKKEADGLFEQLRTSVKQTAYRFQRIISVEGFMADEMIEIFALLHRDLPAAENLPDEIKQEKEILAGVAETIQIKIESIKESVAVFNEDGAGLVGEFAAEAKINEDKDEAYGQALCLWNERMTEADAADASVFFTACAGLEFYAEHLRQFEKRESEYRLKIEKALANFKKETLLYEINTYEEILTYSVSRLRASENADVVKSVGLLDEAHRMLEMILKKNYIVPIRPAPREMFNGREHEVLMAERHEDYVKGEIIKVMNSGYKYKDAVIMRANVIAAR